MSRPVGLKNSAVSELSELAVDVREEAKRDFVFLAQNVLCMSTGAARLKQVASGVCTAMTLEERRALRIWTELRAGQRPSDLNSLETFLLCEAAA